MPLLFVVLLLSANVHAGEDGAVCGLQDPVDLVRAASAKEIGDTFIPDVHSSGESVAKDRQKQLLQKGLFRVC